MIPLFRALLWNTGSSLVIRNSINLFHNICQPRIPTMAGRSLLMPRNDAFVTPSCGFKVKVFLKRRCKDCYFVRRQDRLFVICDTHPRHKQMQVVKKERNTWILTHATQGKVRPW